MKAEDHRTFGEFQRRSYTKDGFGQRVDSPWTKVADAALDIRAVSGREKIRGGVVNATITHTISTRYNPDLLPQKDIADLRLVVGTRLFNIHFGYDYEERHEWIICECTEGTLDGQ